jgi:hypothetical protein
LGFVVWLLNQVGHVFGSGNTSCFSSCTLHGFLRAMTGTNEQKHIDHRRTL